MSGKGRVLVLDDDPGVGETVTFICEELGFEVCAVTDSVAFFEKLERWVPEYIVLDLVMPDMDGVEVMHRLADLNNLSRLIISSGVGGRVLDAAHRTAREHGLSIAGVLSKPFSPSALRACLQDDFTREVSTQGDSDRTASEDVEFDEEDMREGIHRKEFDVVYQPIVFCSSGEISGFEALARWMHPSGLVMPDRFIPVAESLGLVERITEQVLKRAMTWMRATYPDRTWRLSVNISAVSLVSNRLADRLEKICFVSKLGTDRVVLELTETAAMEDPVTALETLTRLRMKGFHLSIDDFGTGYSSMVQLARMPFSEMKIDKSFVMEAPASSESRTIIHSIVDLGHNLGLRVVAEGVEDEQTLEFLQEIGCDCVQGYHVARPMHAREIEGWILKRFGAGSESP